MILIVSWPEDDHAAAVLAELRRDGADAVVVDLARFPQELGLAVRHEASGSRYELLDDGDRLDLDRVAVVWWRRPRGFVLHPEVAHGAYARFAYSECVEALGGLWQSLDAAWINHPSREQLAARKLYQLRVARDVGLDIPSTLVTNDPREARDFVEARGHENVAYKTFLPSEHDWRETRVLRRDELLALDTVRYAPLIFQEYVPPRLDLRITVMGRVMLAAAIHSAEGAYEADYRMDLDNARVEPFDLPRDIRAGIEELMKRLGLVYGAIDMRLDRDGRFVFLEVNPSGEWRFIEDRSDLPITATFSSLLARQARAHNGRPAHSSSGAG